MRQYKIFPLALFFAISVMHQKNLYAQNGKVRYNINGNLSTYLSLNHDSLTHVTINGPGILTVLSRARFKDKSPDSLSYGIVYQVDNIKIKVFNAKNVTRLSERSFIQGLKDRPSTSRTFSLKIAPDVHDIGFSMLRSSPQVDILYKFVPDSIPEWRDIKPVRDTAKIYLKVDGSSPQSYYELSASHSQKFKVTGPTTLRVLSRLEYDYTMQGIVSYRIRVSRNDTILGTYKLSGNPSTEAQFVNRNKHVPGTLEKFFMQVPAGNNVYEFSLMDKRFISLIRISKQKTTK